MSEKVLFIMHYPPPIHGAAMVGSYIKDSKQIMSNFNSKFIRLGTTSSFKERGKTNFKKIFRFIRLLWKSVYTALMFRPDIIYMTLTSNGVGFYKDSLVVLFLKMSGNKIVYHFHNKGVKNRQHKILDNWLYEKVFNNTDVILLSKYLYSDVGKYVPEERIHICPNGIPDYLPNNRKEYVTTEEAVSILFLSNLVRTKGVFVLLDACKLLKEKGVPFNCTLVGGEADIAISELEQKINKLDLTAEVTYAGKKYGEEKEAVFAEADIFAFPTYYPNECFPLVLLEAMQANLPIVSTPEGGIQGIIKEGENGYLVPQKDEKALAKKLEELIKNPKLRKKMGKKGRKRYEEKFTVKHFEERMTNILVKLANKDGEN